MAEELKEKKEIFLSEMADKLLSIYRDMSDLRYFTKESLNVDKVDNIQTTLVELKVMAEEAGESAKAKLLDTMELRFSILHTIGIVDDPDKFADKASGAFAVLEAILLILDGTIPKNRGKIMELIEKREEQF